MAQTQKIGTTATKVFGSAGNLSVIYRGTEVVKTEGNKITLNTGGWRTMTTKARMLQASNQFNLGFCVYQKNYDWFIMIRKTGEVVEFNDRVVTFEV